MGMKDWFSKKSTPSAVEFTEAMINMRQEEEKIRADLMETATTAFPPTFSTAVASTRPGAVYPTAPFPPPAAWCSTTTTFPNDHILVGDYVFEREFLQDLAHILGTHHMSPNQLIKAIGGAFNDLDN